jgi:outer membrane lipoprotein-sorting protein
MVSFRSYLAGVSGAILCAVIELPTQGQPASDRVPPIVSSWIAAQTNIQTWTADVTQTRTLKTLTQPLSATGHVWFAAPNQFRWEIGKPAQTIAIRKSDEMLVIYPKLKRAERYSFGSQQAGPWKDTLALLEAGFPRNESDLNKQFRIIGLSTFSNTAELKLEPRSAAGRRMMPRLSIAFSTSNYVLRSTELEFADGSTMRNEFLNPRLNPKVDSSMFAPAISDEYKIVEPMKH